MPQTRTPLYNGIQINDTANTPGATVVRDSSGNTFQANMNSSGVVNTGEVIQAPNLPTATLTLTNASPVNQLVNANAGAVVVNLPPASASNGQEFFIQKTDAGVNHVTPTGNGSDNIITTAGIATTYALTAQAKSLYLRCDGTQWWGVIGG